MNAGAGVVVAVSGVAVAIALVGWLRQARRERRSGSLRRSHRELASLHRRASALIALLAAVAAVLVPAVAVLAALVALNFLLGRAEGVPFSTFGMYSQPNPRPWSLRFEDPAGVEVNPMSLGIVSSAAKKRFGAELRRRQRSGLDTDEATRLAGELIASWIDERRPATGKLASEPISIVLTVYQFDGASISPSREVVGVAAAQERLPGSSV